jgi:sterol desaturase/sphingolipid hydroxylase (fatty acid hydroxylase superfamily)
MPASTTAIGNGHPLLAPLVYQHELVMLIATFGGMLVLLMLETLWPRRVVARPPVYRWVNNWLLAMVNFTLVLWLVSGLGRLPIPNGIGEGSTLLSSVHPALAFVVVLVVIEAVVYATHRLFHAVPFLWRFHAVHHLDTEVDVTTSHRHHTVEIVIVTLLFIPIVALLGAPLIVVALVALLRLAVALFSHSNISLPEPVDRVLRWVLITPDFHRLHHSAETRHTNSNFGAVLPWFDYLFGTVARVPYVEQVNLRLGMTELRDDRDSRIDRLLLLPLRWPSRRVDTNAESQPPTLA